MILREQFEKEMNNPGTVYGMPDYIKWLENKLETLVQSLSGSETKCSTPKSKQPIETLANDQQDIPKEFSDVINKNFAKG